MNLKFLFNKKYKIKIFEFFAWFLYGEREGESKDGGESGKWKERRGREKIYNRFFYCF